MIVGLCYLVCFLTSFLVWTGLDLHVYFMVTMLAWSYLKGGTNTGLIVPRWMFLVLYHFMIFGLCYVVCCMTSSLVVTGLDVLIDFMLAMLAWVHLKAWMGTGMIVPRWMFLGPG